MKIRILFHRKILVNVWILIHDTKSYFCGLPYHKLLIVKYSFDLKNSKIIWSGKPCLAWNFNIPTVEENLQTSYDTGLQILDSYTDLVKLVIANFMIQACEILDSYNNYND